MKKLLIIDDDKDLRFLLRKFLTGNGFLCFEAKSGEKALEILQENEIDLVLCDFKLRGENGSEVLLAIKELNPSLPVIIITGHSNVRIAVEVIQLGAIDYLVKPLIPAEIISIIHNILDNPSSVKQNEPAVAEPPVNAENKYKKAEPYILSPYESFQEILRQVDLVAPTNYSVIIYGESGSGKEAFAQEIHKRSLRKSKPFLAIDCGAISRELAGSTLFGHEKGAFTGAMNQKIGAFEYAEGGTVFLDEVINLPYETQVSLLRVMQERKMRRVGGNKNIDIDVRIIVASNKRLWSVAKAGSFREDLYHRFNEFSIDVPPLRERKDDILFYANHFLMRCNQELGKNVDGFTSAATNALLDHEWPGNLRELNNIIRRAVLVTETRKIDVDALPLQFSKEVLLNPETHNGTVRALSMHTDPFWQQAEEDYKSIIGVLKETAFNKRKAAQILNISIKALNSKIKVYADFKGFTLDF